MHLRWIPHVASLVSIALAAGALGCGSDDSDSPLPGVYNRSNYGDGGAVPNQPALLPDGAVNPLYCTTGLTECNGACVNLASDTNNCGACGTTCDGSCTTGRCIVTLAASGAGGQGLAVSSTSVYFSGPAGLMSVPLAGGAVTTIAPSANGAVAADTKNVYYSTSEGVMSVPLAGGHPMRIGTYAAAGITSNGEGVCWTAVNGDVVSVPVPEEPAVAVSDGGLDGGDGGDAGDGGEPLPPPPTTLGTSEDYPTGIVAGATSLYWTTSGTLSSAGGYTALTGTVMRYAFSDSLEDGGASHDGGAPQDSGVTTIAANQNYPVAIAADTANVYWTAGGTFGNNYADGTVMKAPALGGPSVALASAQGFPYGIASDATNVYWANNGNGVSAGAIMSVPIAGGAAVTIASGLKAPTFIATDATSVYWTTSGGTVMKATPK